MNEPPFPVVIVGAGPTGLILAHLLGVAGIKVLLIDRGEATVGEARAVTIDDESLRTLQATGMLAQVLPNITQGYGVEYYSWRNRPFARIDPTVREHGYQKRNAFRQDILVKQLCDGLQNHPHVDVRFQHELLSFAQDATGVTLQVATPHGTEAIRCDWLVACDGGRSSVREKLQIALEGNTFGERWLIADLLQRTSPFRHTRTYCDPVRPAIRLPGPQGAVRYEFMLHAHESPEEALNETQLRAWIRQREPADADLPLARKVVYTFHARVAQRWREGRIFLAGDAAHLTPPFAGQGMNSGVRDASNLAWKLAAVIQGTLPERILDTYEQERKPHAWALIRMALQIGKFMQPKSWWGAAFNQTALRAVCLLPPARDYILQLKFKPKPKFHQGFFLGAPSSKAALPAGQLFPQPMVEAPGGGACICWMTCWARALPSFSGPGTRRLHCRREWKPGMFNCCGAVRIFYRLFRPMHQRQRGCRECATAKANWQTSWMHHRPKPWFCDQTAMCLRSCQIPPTPSAGSRSRVFALYGLPVCPPTALKKIDSIHRPYPLG